jgi:hypothetical protein
MKNIYNDDQIYLNDVVMKEERMEEKLKFNQICKQKKVLIQMKGKKEIKKTF